MYHSEEVLEDINGSFTSLRTEKCPAALKRSDATAHENMLMISESGLDHPRRIPIPFWHIWSSDPEHWLYWSWNLWKPAGTTVKWFKSRPGKHHFHPPWCLSCCVRDTCTNKNQECSFVGLLTGLSAWTSGSIKLSFACCCWDRLMFNSHGSRLFWPPATSAACSIWGH